MFVCCEDHLEIAIDDFVDEYEDAPDVYRLDEVSFTAWSIPDHCDYCTRYPKFLVI